MLDSNSSRSIRRSAISLTLLLSALLTAVGSTCLLAGAVFLVAFSPPRHPATPNPSALPTPVDIGRAVLARDIFDSQTGPLAWELQDARAARPPEPKTPASTAALELAPCIDSLRLVATSVVARRPALSLASFSTGTEGKRVLCREGMRVQDHQVVEIRALRVVLRPSGRPLCHASMFAPRSTPPAVPSRPASGAEAKPRARTAGLSEEELSTGIVQVGETRFTLSRALVDKVLSARTELLRVARVIPYEEEGRVLGVKVYGVRSGSLLARLGIQNGDILRSLNGFDLSSPDGALEAYAKLRSLDLLSLSLLRRGQARTLEYQAR